LLNLSWKTLIFGLFEDIFIYPFEFDTRTFEWIGKIFIILNIFIYFFNSFDKNNSSDLVDKEFGKKIRNI